MTETRKTLLILTPGFPKDEDDTACLPFLQTHIAAINKVFPKIEVIIVAFQYPYFKGNYYWNNNLVVSFGGRERSKGHRLLLWIKVWAQLSGFRKSKDILGIFSLWCTECAFIGSWFGRLYGLKHFVWLCGQDAKKGNKYVRLMRPDPHELIGMSDFLKREFYKNYGMEPRHVIPIGVDAAQFPQLPDRTDIDVFGAGSLIPLKQYDVFVRVIKELSYTRPEISSIICGKGDEELRLRSMIKELNICKNVYLAGENPHGEVLQYMQRCRVFLHTSYYEGFGTVCLEALYAGAHVVSFTKPMDANIENWHHVNSTEEMIQTVGELLDNENVQHKRVCAFAAEDVAREMMRLYL